MRFKLVIPRMLAVYFVTDAVLTVVPWTVMAPYLRLVGFTPVDYGIFGAILTISGVASRFLGGFAVDRWNALQAISITYASFTASMLLIATGSKPLIMAGAAVMGAGQIYDLCMKVALSRMFPEDKYDEAFSQYSSLTLAGDGIGAFAGWIPYEVSKVLGMPIVEAYRWTIAVCGLASTTTIAMLWAAGFSRVRGRARGLFEGLNRSVVLTALKISLIEAPLVLGSAIAIGNAYYYFVAKYGVQSNALGTIRGVQCIARAALTPVAPRIKKRIGGSAKTYALVSSTCIPLLIGITLVNSFPIAATLFIARMVVATMCAPLVSSLIMRLIPPDVRGRATSMIGLVSRGVRAFGRAVGGELMALNIELPFRVASVFYAASYALVAIVLGAMERRATQRACGCSSRSEPSQ